MIDPKTLATIVLNIAANAADLEWDVDQEGENSLWKVTASNVTLHQASQVCDKLFSRFVYWSMSQGLDFTIWKCRGVGAIRVRYEDWNLTLEFQALEGDLFNVRCEL